MHLLIATLLLVTGPALTGAQPEPAIAGTWFGAVDTDRGQMEIGLSVTVEDQKLKGVLKTAHGDWAVTAITEKAGVWTVAFAGGGNEGQMIGRITGASFTGDWKSKMANGTFEVTRSKRKG